MRWRAPCCVGRLPLIASIAGAALALAAPAHAADDSVAFQVDPGHTGLASGSTLAEPPLAVRWTRSLGTATSYPLIAEGKVFVVYQDPARSGATLAALDGASGTTLWWRPLPAWAALAYDDGRLFALGSDGVLTAVSGATGESLWIRQLAEPFDDSAPVASGGMVYVGLTWSGGNVYGLDARDGKTVWTSSISDGASPAVAGGQVFATTGECAQGLDRLTGRRLWSASLGYCYHGDDRVATDGGRVIAGRHIVDASSGRLQEMLTGTQRPAMAGSTLLTPNNYVLQARDLRTGVGSWEFEVARPLSSAPVVSNHVAYVGASDGNVYGVDLRTGEPVWQSAVAASSTPVGAAGLALGGGMLVVPARGTLTAFSGTELAPAPGSDLRIITGTHGVTTTPSAEFTFSASGTGFTYRCRLDGGAWAPCAGAQRYEGLENGPHAFEVETVDAISGEPVGLAARGFSIDDAPPKTTITAGPASVSKSSSASFSFSTESAATVECRLDGGPWKACSSPIYHSGLAEGDHRFEARATDGAGNVESPPAAHAWTVDTRPPDATITSGPQGSTTNRSATFEFRSNDPDVSFECQLDGAGYRSCSSPTTYTDLTDGRHSFSVRSRDRADNLGYSSTWYWTVDATPPETTITNGPQGTTRTGNVSFEFVASESGSRFECRLDGASWGACSTPRSYTDLPDGTHTFEVRATDPVGGTDPSPAARTWTIDRTPPETTIDTSNSGASGTSAARFEFSASEPGVTFDCQLDDGAWEACTSPISYVGLTSGTHVFRVQATDSAGNRDLTAAALTFVLQRALTPPATQEPTSPSGFEATPGPEPSTPTALASALGPIAPATLRRKRGVEFSYTAPAAGTLRVKILRRGARRRVLARGSLAFTHATTGEGVIKPTRAGRRALRGRRAMRALIRVTFKPRTGAALSATRRVTLR